MDEIWADVNGYEGLYMVSNYGRVLSLSRKVNQGKYGKTRSLEEKLLRAIDNGRGYLVVGLRDHNKRKNFYIHRLVAEHFIPNCCDGEYVNHKDFDTHNNRVDNLEWCTQKQNVRYSAHKMRHSHKSWKSSATGEKYIYHRYGGFRLCIRGKIDKVFPTLEDAIRAREVVLSGEEYYAD